MHLDLEYNSSRDKLRIPEYGRHVQNMVRHARTIEDDAMRQQFIETVVDLIMQMHPQNRNLEDYRDKMWKHVFRIAEYDLEVMPPNGEIPTYEGRRKKPDPIPYPINNPKFRHYGHNVLKLIAKAIEMPDGEKKEGFVRVIGSYMKLAYKTWNREHFVSDELILEDLGTLSNGELSIQGHAFLDDLTRSNAKKSGSGQRSSRSPRDRDGRNQRKNNGGGRSNNRRNNNNSRRRWK